MPTAMAPLFRFDANTHEYLDLERNEVLPHITGMLQATGWIDDRFYTAESSARGQAVHRLATEHDLGALDIITYQSEYRGWLLGHIKTVSIVRPEWTHLEEPFVHPRLRFGGRPDRVGRIFGAVAVWEIKSGAPDKAHRIQTALQAILVAPAVGLPPEAILRYAEHLKPTGKYALDQHTSRWDFDEAYRVIKRCCA